MYFFKLLKPNPYFYIYLWFRNDPKVGRYINKIEGNNNFVFMSMQTIKCLRFVCVGLIRKA